MSFIQNLFTSRDNNANSATYVGQQDRLWWDPVTNQFYYSDGSTPGGFPVGGGNVVTNQLVNGVYQFVLDSSGNITSPGAISAVGNITAGYFIGNGSQLSSITGANVTGQVSNALVATLAVVAGTVSANAQPNITSLGTLTSVSVSGNANAGNFNTAGQVSATGNISGNYFVGNGSQLTGLYSNTNVSAYLASGSLTANIITSANIAGSYFLGNGAFLTGITANSNYSNTNVAAFLPTYTGNLVALTGDVTTTANVTGGNINTAGLVSATANVIGGNVSTAGLISASGNVTGGNVLTAGQVSATGNVTGNYILGNGSQLTGINATTNKIFNGNSYANVDTPNGNVVVGANGQLWTFGTSGNLTLPSNTSSINYANGSPYGGAGNITAGNVRIQDENVTLTNAVNTINFAGNGVVATNVGNLVTVTISGAPTNIPVQTGNAGLVLMTDGGNLYWNGALGASYEIDGSYANAIPPGATLDAGSANADYTGETQVYGGAASSDYSLTLSSIALTGQYEDLIDAPDSTAVPLTATSSGVKGQMAFNANWLYVCINDNQWRRASLNSW